jgi:hypothetical protein
MPLYHLEASFTQSAAGLGKAQELQEGILFLTERCGNVIENKGPLWKSRDGAGMSLITKEIFAECGNVVENKGS